MTQVTLRSLTKRYHGQAAPILKDFSLTVANGELLALLGPSGSGKSTLLKLIAGVEQPDKGDILFDGTSVLHIPPNKRGAVFMFQKSYLFPFLSVAENIGFGLKVKHIPAPAVRSAVAKMLDLIGLPGIEKRKPGQLSGGEQQRVALARALVINPKLLLLDEPLSSLDTTVRLTLQQAIRNIQRELGITTILVTHDLGEAMAMSDRMALLLAGEMVAQGKPETLFHRPPNFAAAQFMGVSTFLRGQRHAETLETALGTLKIADADSKTGLATYAIRPEHIRIQTKGGDNTLPGLVKDCVFRGEYVEYQVLVGELNVRARLPMPAPTFAHGESVFVQLPVDHLFAVSD
jgi:ABC-type Fe3+/spermidine/putrescine transport system ATPase subunit